MHAPHSRNELRPEREARTSASYNFFRKNPWLTESFHSNFAARRAIIRPVSSGIREIPFPGLVNLRTEFKEALMIKINVLYPNGEGRVFDMSYYLAKHIPMVRRLSGAALKKVDVEEGIAGLAVGSPPAF